MLPLKLRIRMLSKIAQTVPGAPSAPSDPAAPGAPADPASPTAPATPESTTATQIPPPPNFQASAAYGWMTNSYNSNTVASIDKLASIINMALHYASNSKFNLLILRNQSFQVDPSAAPSIDAKNLLNLSVLLYKTYLNSGNQFPQKPTGNQIHEWNSRIEQSQAFLNLSQLSPTGTVAQKIPGNLKDNILNILRELDRYNPAKPQ